METLETHNQWVKDNAHQMSKEQLEAILKDYQNGNTVHGVHEEMIGLVKKELEEINQLSLLDQIKEDEKK